MSWQKKAAKLIRQADPEGCPKGVYVIDFADIEKLDSRLSGGECSAWTSSILDLLCRDYLEAKGLWRGRGFCCVVRRAQSRTESELFGSVLHEYAHYCCWPIPVEKVTLPNPKEYRDSKMPVLLSNPGDGLYNAALPRWHKHEQDFIRACCHLACRTVDGTVNIEDLTFGLVYYFVEELNFYWALIEELDERDTRPIRDVLATEPPKRFAEFWERAAKPFEAKQVAG